MRRSAAIATLATGTLAATTLVACRQRASDAPPDSARVRAVAERVAQDTAARAWRHAVGVDSVQTRGDTTVIWVSPRDWMATDAPQAVVRVSRDGRILGIRWIMGG
jgi:hypothetical protein